METYKISKGQRYDPDGAVVGHGMLFATYTRDAVLDTGYPPAESEQEEVMAAVRRVIATGQGETVVIGTRVSTAVATAGEQAMAAELAACMGWMADQGCARHGEFCHS